VHLREFCGVKVLWACKSMPRSLLVREVVCFSQRLFQRCRCPLVSWRCYLARAAPTCGALCSSCFIQGSAPGVSDKHCCAVLCWSEPLCHLLRAKADTKPSGQCWELIWGSVKSQSSDGGAVCCRASNICHLWTELQAGLQPARRGCVLWHHRWGKKAQIAHNACLSNLVWNCSISSFGTAMNLKAECRQVAKILWLYLAALCFSNSA